MSLAVQANFVRAPNQKWLPANNFNGGYFFSRCIHCAAQHVFCFFNDKFKMVDNFQLQKGTFFKVFIELSR